MKKVVLIGDSIRMIGYGKPVAERLSPEYEEDLAREINLRGMEITPLIISRIEKNQRHVCDGELLMLAKTLGVSMEWLCGEDV